LTLIVPVAQIVNQSNNPLVKKHETWERVELCFIANVLNGFAFDSQKFKKNEGTPLIRIRDIDRADTDCNYIGDFDLQYLVKSGDLLIGMDGDFNCSRWKGSDALLNQRVCKIIQKSEYYSQKFLDYVLPSYLQEINKNTSSLTVKHLSSQSIKEIPLPLPPLPEQHRIVTKIEELFTQLDAGVASLKKVQAQLKRYRHAVLKAAFEGMLTQEWRIEHKKEIIQKSNLTKEIIETRIKKLISKKGPLTEFNTSELSSLPDTWFWLKLDLVCNKIQDGMHFSPPEQFNQPSKGRYLYITAKNIKNYGIELKNVTYIDEKYHREIFRRCNPEFEDILLIKDGVTAGVVCVNQLREEFSLLSSVALLKPDKNLLNSRYLKYYLASPEGFSMIVGQMTGVAIKRIILEKIKKSPIILPSLLEQEIIVSEIEQRLSIVDEVETVISTSLRQAESLRQSILKRAFEGKLVPQDPNDEPASILLERIKAEKTHHATEVKKGKTLQPKSPKRKVPNGN
jgi:type I restriction enzyme, S subunit